MAKYQHRIGRNLIPMEPTLSYIGDKIFVGDVLATNSDGTVNNSSAILSYCPMAKSQHRIGRNLIPMGPTLRKAPLVHQVGAPAVLNTEAQWLMTSRCGSQSYKVVPTQD